ARDHQDDRAGRGYHPVVVLAAGIEQRHRRARIFRKPPRHRAAAGAATHHHEIECVTHAPLPCLSYSSFRARSPRSPWNDGLILPQTSAFALHLARVVPRAEFSKENRHFTCHKILKTGGLGLSKAGER